MIGILRKFLGYSCVVFCVLDFLILVLSYIKTGHPVYQHEGFVYMCLAVLFLDEKK